MSDLELRPLEIGEILDRTFTLYRRYLLFFVGLAAIPRLPGLIINLVRIAFTDPAASPIATIVWTIVASLVLAVGVLFAQGVTVLGVSEVYLGRTISIGEALQRAAGRFWPMLGVLFLSGLATGVGFLALVVGAVIVVCRLLVCVPVTVIEGKSPGDAFSRSWELTKGFAMRAFLILCLYYVVALGFGAIAALPTVVSIAMHGALAATQDRTLLTVQALLSEAFSALLTPILLIATSVYYYDLRVRKEAFDLQHMMNASPVTGAIVPEA